jgi:uncharacterized protein YodC (DUF2158 family)
MQIGDVRHLNSGGPAMTVVAIADGKFIFQWIQQIGYGKLKINIDDVEKITYAANRDEKATEEPKMTHDSNTEFGEPFSCRG